VLGSLGVQQMGIRIKLIASAQKLIAFQSDGPGATASPRASSSRTATSRGKEQGGAGGGGEGDGGGDANGRACGCVSRDEMQDIKDCLLELRGNATEHYRLLADSLLDVVLQVCLHGNDVYVCLCLLVLCVCVCW